MCSDEKGGIAMSYQFGISESLCSTLFSSLNNSSSTNYMSNLAGLCGDYSMIRSGSYGKLLRAYYEKDSTDTAKKDSKKTDTVSDATASAENKKMALVKSDALDLEKSADALTVTGKNSLFEKKEITTEDKEGNKTTKLDYDRTAIEKAVMAFVDDYNALVDSGKNVSSITMLNKSMQISDLTAKNVNQLADVGINVTSGNRLSVDKDKLASADVGKLKDLFEGSNSYASKVADKAGEMAQTAKLEATKSSSLYTSSGSYYSSSKYYSSMFESFY